MRIFGLEISISPRTANDAVIWNPQHRHTSSIGGLTPTQLREELARVYYMAERDQSYWVSTADRSQRLHVVTSYSELRALQEVRSRQVNGQINTYRRVVLEPRRS